MFAKFEGKTLFDLLDFLTSNVMLPVGGFFIAIFVAWLMNNSKVAEELDASPQNKSYRLWRFLLRYITPVGIGLVFLNVIGVIS